jgi:hypothetical protein
MRCNLQLPAKSHAPRHFVGCPPMARRTCPCARRSPRHGVGFAFLIAPDRRLNTSSAKRSAPTRRVSQASLRFRGMPSGFTSQFTTGGIGRDAIGSAVQRSIFIAFTSGRRRNSRTHGNELGSQCQPVPSRIRSLARLTPRGVALR